MTDSYGPHPKDIRANVTFALDLAESLGVTTQGINADEWGNVTIYAWDVPAEGIDAIAEREGWQPESFDGANWHGRRQVFSVGDHSVRVDLVGDLTLVAEVSA